MAPAREYSLSLLNPINKTLPRTAGVGSRTTNAVLHTGSLEVTVEILSVRVVLEDPLVVIRHSVLMVSSQSRGSREPTHE